MRILIAEDDPTLAYGLQCTLRQSGYAVDWVGNGSEADAALASDEFDLLILDLSLPKLSGFEVLKRLRARNSRLPVLLLTALDSVTDRVRGLDAGADDYLAKPFELAELEARVRALTRRGMSGAAYDHQARRLCLRPGGARCRPRRRTARTVRARVESARAVAAAPGTMVQQGRSSSRTCAGGARRSAPMRSRCTCTACARNWSRAA